ncbi:MAG: hypothetical protein B6241_15025 [Spirochaetaceae bacterium 4572_59]|nr:MAG: hypothetical protein B6241_15025 [Spirochaetaceae bacterium 4572_59]
MKKFFGIMLAVMMLFAFISCDSGGSSRAEDLTVDDITPADLVDYTSNGVAPSPTGETELKGVAGLGDAMGDVSEEWLNDALGIDLATLMAGDVNLGVSRTVTGPTESEIDAIIAAFESGDGSETVSASITNETVDLSTLDDTMNGDFTLNASVTADLAASSSSSSASYSIDVEAEIGIEGLGITSSTPLMDMPEFVLNATTDTSVDLRSTESGGTVSVDTNSAVVLAFSLSNFVYTDDFYNTVTLPSGKYVYTATINESVSVDMASEDQDVSVSATISLNIYGNDGSSLASYEFSAADFMED